MIDKSQVIPFLLGACPDFQAPLDEYRAGWGGEEPGIYNEIGTLAHCLVDAVREDRTESFPAVFERVEQLIVEGDEEARAMVTIGLLEDLQNIASWQPFGRDVFLPWLRPTTRAAWFEVIEVWKDKDSLADVLREEAQRKGNDEGV